jgi:hypothetical protein
MIKPNVTPQELVDFLNELVVLDREAMRDIIYARVECNEALANHPTVQVATYDRFPYALGLLGVLNGLFGVYDEGSRKGWGCIGIQYPDTRFVIIPNET